MFIVGCWLIVDRWLVVDVDAESVGGRNSDDGGGGGGSDGGGNGGIASDGGGNESGGGCLYPDLRVARDVCQLAQICSVINNNNNL